jgi:hypothetical protein
MAGSLTGRYVPELTPRLQLRVFEITFSGILILAPHINDV